MNLIEFIFIITEKRVKDTKNKLCKNMIHNPLYDRSGPQIPQYEIVSPHPDSGSSAQFIRPASTTHPDYDTINTLRRTYHYRRDTPATEDHVDQPAQRMSKFRRSLEAHSPPYDIMSELTSSSMSAPSLMGLKKNGRERNKLHLTLSLGNTDLRNNHGVVTSDSDDNYTILNPVASRQSIGCNFMRNETFI
jgi:hypothetical protein